MCFIILLSFITYLHTFFIYDITYNQPYKCVLPYHIPEYSWLLLFKMKGNKKLIGSVLYQGKYLVLAEVFAFSEYLSLHNQLSINDQK